MRLFLSTIEKKKPMNFWDDSKLAPGVLLKRQIEEVLNKSQAGLLTVEKVLALQVVAGVELTKLMDVAQQAGKKTYWLHVGPRTASMRTPYQRCMMIPRLHCRSR